jgi:hypothetical protein
LLEAKQLLPGQGGVVCPLQLPSQFTILNITALTQPSSPAELAKTPIRVGSLAFDFSLIIDYFRLETVIS